MTRREVDRAEHIARLKRSLYDHRNALRVGFTDTVAPNGSLIATAAEQSSACMHVIRDMERALRRLGEL